MPNFGYHFARLRGGVLRQFYRAFLPLITHRRIAGPRSIALNVFSYSGEQALPEQIASIRSFLRNVGRPKQFTVVSDGSYSERSVRLLRSIDPCVEVQRSSPPPRSEWPDKFRRYLETHETGKQLALIMSLPADGPALYVDSDVLFFAGAIDLAARIAGNGAPAYYLADCQFAGDERLLVDAGEQRDPVNTGVLLLFRRLDWSPAIDRFQKMAGEPSFFTNQTLAHLVMHANAAGPLEPSKYVLRLDDQFVYADRYASPTLALRHYVNPVRHKFWTSLGRTSR
jgi:hypothetical protein